MFWVWLGVVLFVGLVLGPLLWWGRLTADRLPQARALLQTQRSQLETEFLQAAGASGKPRGLRWKACEWEPEVAFAREKATGRLAALVAVTIQFEAVEGGDMEGLPAVGNLRNASAVFFFHRGRWYTTGKTVFNLNPDEALSHFQNLYERLPA